MYITECLLAFLSLYAGLAHSFSWEIVIGTSDQLQFYDVNGNLTHREYVAPDFIKRITYDPVHNRVLFANWHNIYSFKIASKTLETLVTITNNSLTSMTYDPATELLFWNEHRKGMNSISLKTGLSNRRNEKQLILSEDYFYDMTVDICGGFIHWISGYLNLERARFDGSGREIVTGGVSMDFINIDHQTQKIYWYKSVFNRTIPWGSIKCADLNGKNTREVFQVLRPQLDFESYQMAFSKDHIYWKKCDDFNLNCSIWKIPKNPPSDIDLFIKSNTFVENELGIWAIAAKYSIEDLTRGVQNCDRLKNLLPIDSVTNVSSDVSLLCVHGTKVSGEPRCECAQGYSGERCDVSV